MASKLQPFKKTRISFDLPKLHQQLHHSIYMQDQQVADVTSHKHLGLHLSDDCSWHNQIEFIKEKAWVRLNLMRKFKYELDRRSLEIIYISFIRPILECGDVVWSNCNQQEKQELEKNSNRCCKDCHRHNKISFDSGFI